MEPDGTVTVTIAVSGYGGVGRVTETIPPEFAYVEDSLSATPADTASISMANSDIAQGVVAVNLLGATSISYQVTTTTAEDTYDFSGTVRAQDGTEADVGGDVTVTVSTVRGPDPDPNGLEFDIVSSKAVKAARVSGVGAPIGGDPDKALAWAIDETGFTFNEDHFDGATGDFEVKRMVTGSSASSSRSPGHLPQAQSVLLFLIPTLMATQLPQSLPVP